MEHWWNETIHRKAEVLGEETVMVQFVYHELHVYCSGICGGLNSILNFDGT
jgi:hypothetical protein